MKEARITLLGLLQQGELYGYQIKRILEEEPYWPWADVPIASLYRELSDMDGEGLVERAAKEGAQGRTARHVFRLTDRGRDELARLLREAWTQAEMPRSLQDVAAFFLNALPEDELLSLLQARVTGLEQEMQRLQTFFVERYGEDQPPALRAIHDHARAHLQAEIDWTLALSVQVESGAFSTKPQPTTPAMARRRTPRQGKSVGAFTFVLHSHIPYCRMAGRWPHGEEWIHEAAAETYIPMLNALYDLKESGVDYRMTINLTPVLAEQLADQDVRRHFILYLEDEIKRATADIPRFGEEGNEHLEYLARWYRDWYTWVRDTYVSRFRGDIVGAFRQLQDEEYIEIITSAATHGYLPLLARDSSIYGQLRTGIESYRRLLGRSPRAIWLPECAYRPAYVDDDGITRPALEEFLAGQGITCFFVETHAIQGGRPVGKAGGDAVIGPYASIRRRYVIPPSEAAEGHGVTYRPYYVAGGTEGLTEPPVAAIGRNNRTGQQVWSAEWGYPGDADYREFHKKDHESGLQYWRVTGPRVDLGAKDYYHPEWAEQKVAGHARHYADLVEQLLQEYRDTTGGYGLISANYDAELFGHWWFEGVNWIKEVLSELAARGTVELTTASAFLAQHEPEQAIALPESSWGAGGGHWTWDNPDTHWMWEPLHEAERRMEHLADRYPHAEGALLAVLNQAARELLLLQSSDWPFLVTTGQAAEYAIERFRSHLGRFQQLADLADAELGERAVAVAEALYDIDKVFPDIDYRWFRGRQGSAR